MNVLCSPPCICPGALVRSLPSSDSRRQRTCVEVVAHGTPNRSLGRYDRSTHSVVVGWSEVRALVCPTEHSAGNPCLGAPTLVSVCMSCLAPSYGTGGARDTVWGEAY